MMDAIWKWIQDNQVLSGIGAVVLSAILGVIGYFYKRRKESPTASPAVQQLANGGAGNAVNVAGSVGSLTVGAPQPTSPPAENIRVDIAKLVAPIRLPNVIELHVGDRTIPHEVTTLSPAQVEIVSHNLTGTPATVDVIRLFKEGTNEEVCRWSKPAWVGGLKFAELTLNLPSGYTLPPRWRGIIEVVTIRGGVFRSKPFQWGKPLN